jgi:hypothetical protein
VAKRFLAIDWDQNQLHIVAASVSGGSVRFHQAAVFETDASPSPLEAERLGKLLRERMKSLGIGPAPVLACLGRERVILKEVRFPAVPPHEEPAVVRFQAVKELTDAADESVIDYVTLPSASPDSERRAQVMIARRDLVNAYKTLCESAGLKCAGLAPRPYGMVACLRRLLGTSVLVPAPDPPGAAVALITVGEKWAEFCILQGEHILQSRTLTLGPGLAAEIRRNLAVHNGHQPGAPVQAVYLALSGEQAAFREKLVESLDIPVHTFDPFGGAEGKELPSSGRGTFVGAIGLLHLMAQRNELPVNFVLVKQPRPPKDPNQRVYALVAVALVLVLLGGFVAGHFVRKNKEAELAYWMTEQDDFDKELVKVREKTRVLQALADWETVNWTDELYDLTARMPEITQDFKLLSLRASPEKPPTRPGAPLAANAKPGTPSIKELGLHPVARLHLELASPAQGPLNALNDAFQKPEKNGNVYYRPLSHSVIRRKYEKPILIRKRAPGDYSREIIVGTRLAKEP